jgi:hypothetical protein
MILRRRYRPVYYPVDRLNTFFLLLRKATFLHPIHLTFAAGSFQKTFAAALYCPYVPAGGAGHEGARMTGSNSRVYPGALLFSIILRFCIIPVTAGSFPAIACQKLPGNSPDDSDLGIAQTSDKGHIAAGHSESSPSTISYNVYRALVWECS